MAKLIPGERILVLDTQFVLDIAGISACADWYPEREDYTDYGDCNQVRYDTEVWIAGPGASSTKLQFERATQVDHPDQFEPMNGTPIIINAAGSDGAWFAVEFGRSGSIAADLYPRGIGRIHVWNEDTATDHFTHVRLRMIATGQRLVAGGR